MMKKIKNFILLVSLSLTIFIFQNANAAGTGVIDDTNKFAWSETTGWVNFKPVNGGITVHDGYLDGFAWSETVGWIKLGADGGGPYANTSSTDWGVNRDASGNLSGYAWSENSGWINFNPTHS